MSRYLVEGIFRDQAGNVVTSGTASPLLAGTATAATVYTTLASAVGVTSVTSDATTGIFTFYWDDLDYASDQAFDITLSKTGYTSTTYYSVRGNVVLGSYTITGAKTVSTYHSVPKGVTYVKGTAGTIAFTGTFEAGMYQVFSGFSAGDITFGRGSVKEVIPHWWQVPDGATSDSVAINSAIQSITSVGGTVRFPTPAIYVATSQSLVSSYHAVNLISDMGCPDSTSPYGSYIKIGGNITGSVFKYSVPGSRGTSGGGVIRGLSFADISNISPFGTQGNYTLTAALELTDFNHGLVDNCYFHFLLGSAIKSQFMVKSNITNCVFQYCGATSQPTVDLVSDSGGVYVNQSLVISNCKFEANFSTAYVSIGRYSEDVKVLGCGFEATPAVSGTNQYFINNNASSTIISDCHFHSNNTTSVICNTYGDQCQISTCEFNSTPTSAPKLDLVSTNAQVSNCIFRGLDTATQIYARNGLCHFTGNRVYYGGNVILGNNSSWIGGIVDSLTTTQAYAITAGEGTTVSSTVIRACSVSGGLILSGTTPASIGNIITANAGIGLRNESANAGIVGNRVYSNTGGDASFIWYPKGYTANSNFFYDAAYPLQGSATWNPGSLANGASESKDVTVTGAVIGDTALAAFPMLATSAVVAGMSLSASVYQNNTARVTITNNSGAPVDLDSATVVVQVLKQT